MSKVAGNVVKVILVFILVTVVCELALKVL